MQGAWGRGLSESVKKENLWQKSFLPIILNEVLKMCEKWYIWSADVKANLMKTTRNKRSGWWHLPNFYKMYACSKVDGIQGAVIFHLILVRDCRQ